MEHLLLGMHTTTLGELPSVITDPNIFRSPKETKPHLFVQGRTTGRSKETRLLLWFTVVVLVNTPANTAADARNQVGDVCPRCPHSWGAAL